MRKVGHPAALRGLALRAAVLALIVAALIAVPGLGWLWSAVLVMLALTAYFLGRRPARGHFVYAAASAIVIPDLLGFALVAVFLCIPVWATPGWPATGALNPAAWLLWPMAGLSAGLIYIAWRADSFAVSLTAAGLKITQGLWHWDLPYAEISQVRPWQRDLPRWMRALVPLLVFFGRPGPAGAIMLARERRGIELVLAAPPTPAPACMTRRIAVPGSVPGPVRIPRIVIETDSLRPSGPKFLTALSGKGIPVSFRRPGLDRVPRPHCKDTP